MLGEALDDVGTVDPKVAVLAIVRVAPVRRCCPSGGIRHGQKEKATGLHDAHEFVQSCAIICDVFKNVIADDDVIVVVGPVDVLEIERVFPAVYRDFKMAELLGLDCPVATKLKNPQRL